MIIYKMLGKLTKVILILAAVLAIYLMGRRSHKPVTSGTEMVLDTSGTFEPVTGDTSIPLIKRPFEAKVTPQKIISHPLIRDTTKPREFPEAIVRLDYNAPDLTFSSFVLESGAVDTFKTYFFPGVGSRFRIRPTADGWHVRRRKAFFSHKELNLGISLRDGGFLEGDIGISRISFRAGIYAKGTDASADISVRYKLF